MSLFVLHFSLYLCYQPKAFLLLLTDLISFPNFPLPFGLAGGMREQELKEIKLHGVSTVGLKNIIEFIYTSHVSLSLGTLQDTLEAASFLQVLPVLSFCNQLLSSEV